MKIFALTVILFACVTTANAGLRAIYEDEVIAQRSELIVVAHLKENSIQYVPRQEIFGAKWWEHNAMLIITEFIKGKSETNEIPIIIHYGLDPIGGGHVSQDGFMMDVRRNQKDYPTNLVQIFDTGNCMMGGKPIVEDASQDNIWFLRRLGGDLGREPVKTNNLGVLDPQDVQPLKLKEYFQTYLSANPQSAVESYAINHPEVAGRAKRYLNHLEVQRILKLENLTNRIEALLPHYLNRELWADGNFNRNKDEIRNGIISCGSVAGEKLIPIFNDPAHAGFRESIILIWRDMNYTNVAPMLIKLLENHDQFWAGQILTTNWWNTDVSSKLTEDRRVNYGEIYYSVAALRVFHCFEAKEAIELTKKRWEVIHFDNPQIVEECDAALKEFVNQK